MRRLALGLALLLAACGGGDDPDDSGSPATRATATTDASATEPAVPGVELLEVEPVDTSAPRPLFAWAAVNGAARYSLLVLGDDGAAYWAWEGAETQVHLGGGTDEPLPDDAEGPTVDHAASWFVVAHDEAGTPIAASAAVEL